MQTSGEVKVHAFMVKKAGLSDEEFHRHWRDPHGHLAMRVREIIRYVQDHTFGAQPRFDGWAPLIYHGLPAVWFADIGTATGLHSNPDFQESHADEENLVERDQLGWLRSTETVLVPGPVPAPGDPERWKLTLLVRGRPSWAGEAFRSAIVDVARDVAGTLPDLVRATVSLPRPDQYTETRALYDAVLEFAFGSRAELEVATDVFAERSLPAVERVVDPAGSSAAWTYEERWIWP
ncbi:EthD domain-containing protein [Blastococcus sp. PRF04-17]|uniref:EthD domain-containing protein n=1 Tax=Blastococcus sp. PRF04-17 TaxID=2933797 RepID=UPI001FF401CC|nr:EthD domain-containing protein [Blastococcus sp. PRF04-17]UOY01751.1 EthD domain-containing protein [Blastococcus sp. PRF04-17]